MTRYDNRQRISSRGCAHCSGGARISQMLSKLAIASCFPKRDSKQFLPYILLEASTSHVERYREIIPPAGKVFAQLPLRLNQIWMALILKRLAQPHATGIVVFPQYGYQALVAGDQFQLSDRRANCFRNQAHDLPLSGS